VEIDNLESEVHRLSLSTFALDNLSPFREVFKIQINEDHGVINGFSVRFTNRIKKEKGIEWKEINSALGCIVWVLLALIDKLQLKSIDLKLGMTNTGFKIDYKENSKFESCILVGSLYADKLDDDFNKAMEYLSYCLQKIYEEINSTCEIQLMHKIERGAIGGKSLKYDSKVCDIWQLAMKYFLEDLKHILTYV